MRNLKHYSDDSFEFYKAVVKSKRNSQQDPTYKDRVSKLNPNIEVVFKEYDSKFSKNSLEALNSFGYSAGQKDDLLGLYSYSSKIMQQLKVKLTTTETNRAINICSNCTISEVNSFDHCLPQSEFPEYVVNPKNLFPSCTTCNGYKSDIWRTGGTRAFLNLYLDNLPKAQYLFVDVSIKGADIETKFYLDNQNGIDSVLFARIANHYDKLHLFKRFSDNSDLVITPLINSIVPYVKKLALEDITEASKDTNERNKKAFGFNFWHCILIESLLEHKEFMDKVYKGVIVR
jgi:hypothetical protein